MVIKTQPFRAKGPLTGISQGDSADLHIFRNSKGAYYTGYFINTDSANFLELHVIEGQSETPFTVPPGFGIIFKNQKVEEFQVMLSTLNPTAKNVGYQFQGKTHTPSTNFEEAMLESDSELFFRAVVSPSLIRPFYITFSGDITPGTSGAFGAPVDMKAPSLPFFVPLALRVYGNDGNAPALGEQVTVKLAFTFDDGTTLSQNVADFRLVNWLVSGDVISGSNNPIVPQFTAPGYLDPVAILGIVMDKRITKVSLSASSDQASTDVLCFFDLYGFEYA